jgi:hypothetical protein
MITMKKSIYMIMLIISLVIGSSTALAETSANKSLELHRGLNVLHEYVDDNEDGAMQVVVSLVNMGTKDVTGINSIGITLTDTDGKTANRVFSNDKLKSLSLVAGGAMLYDFRVVNEEKLKVFGVEVSTTNDATYGKTSLYGGFNIVVDNKVLHPSTNPIISEEGNTLVPMRSIFEALGAEVSWDADTVTATVKTKSRTLTLKLGDKYAVDQRSTKYKINEEVKIIDGSIMLPLRDGVLLLGASTWFNVDGDAIIIAVNKF